MDNENQTKPKARLVAVTQREVGQRIDNYLIRVLKGVPKTRIYKAVRSGEVRINGSRIKVSQKLIEGDKVRIPPIRYAKENQAAVIPPKLLDSVPVLFEDEYFIVVNKPAGLAVHGGTGIPYGLIEAFRQLRPKTQFLELVHRLDRETSGCLMLAKTRQSLLELQNQLGHERNVGKHYIALVKGDWKGKSKSICLSLRKKVESGKDKRMVVDPDGQTALSRISAIERFSDATLVNVELLTGRMHQARVHCASSGYPIAGDRLYGDAEFNKKKKTLGLGRLFLHAHKLILKHPITNKPMDISAALPDQLQEFLSRL